MDQLFHPTHYNVWNYVPMLRFKLNHVSQRGPWSIITNVHKTNTRSCECKEMITIWFDMHTYAYFNNRINILRQRQNGHHFEDDVCKWIYLWKFMNLIKKKSLKILPKSRINRILALVQIMVGAHEATLPEPMMVRLPTHIFVIRPQWLNICTTNLGH